MHTDYSLMHGVAFGMLLSSPFWGALYGIARHMGWL